MGPKSALKLETHFQEKKLVEENIHFIFENLKMIEKSKIQIQSIKEESEIEGLKVAKDSAIPGKPYVYFY